jgi:hypothetical protein
MKKEKEYKPDAGVFAIGLTKKEIKMLTFWACIGIVRSKGGTYERIIPSLLKYFSKKLKIKLPFKPEFNAKMKSYRRKIRTN